VQRPLDAGAVVVAEVADPFDDVVQILGRNRLGPEEDLAAGQTRLRLAAEVHDDFEELVALGQGLERFADLGWQDFEQEAEVVGNSELGNESWLLVCVRH
jgi:hypothetical protein